MQSFSTRLVKVCQHIRPAAVSHKSPAMLSLTPMRCFSQSTEGEKIDFGFQKVDRDEKKGKVAEVFSNVADSYDVMNDAMSLGVHRVWKNTFVDAIGPLKRRKVLNADYEVIDEVPLKILDVAGGTGDISFRMLDKARRDEPAAGSKSYLVIALFVAGA